MIQEIIVYLIIALVCWFLLRSALRLFRAEERKGGTCAGCSGCDVKPLHTPHDSSCREARK